MPVYYLPPQRNWGHSVSDAVKEFMRYYLLSKQTTQDKKFRERELDLRERQFAETLAESQRQAKRAKAIDAFLGLTKGARENKPINISGPGQTFSNPMAVYGSPGVKRSAQRTSMAQAGDLSGLEGYEKPTISIGSGGQTNLSFRPKTSYSESYLADLKNAVSAIDRKADRYKVYQRIASQYPQYSTELKRILLFTTPEDRAQILSTLLGIEGE
jgi:hypothetical protein